MQEEEPFSSRAFDGDPPLEERFASLAENNWFKCAPGVKVAREPHMGLKNVLVVEQTLKP